MGFLGPVLIVSSILMAGFGYVLYVPIPAGFSQPWKVQMAYSSVKFMKVVSSCGEALGLGPAYKHTRTVFNFASRVKMWLAGKEDSLKIFDTDFDGVPVRVYVPLGKSDSLPGLLYFHGGGFTIGSVDSYDSLTRRLAKRTKAVVVSVEYRLAPEHVFPAALDDCLAATKYFLKNAAEFGVDSTRVGVGGDSAGGNLAAGVSLKLRDEKFSPKLKLQLLIYPTLQFVDKLTPSFQQNAFDTIVGKKDSQTFLPYYVQGHDRNGPRIGQNMHTTPQLKKKLFSTYLNVEKLPKKFTSTNYVPRKDDYGDESLFKEMEHVLMNPYASPLLAENLTNLPKVYLFTGHNDVLRDDGFWYALRLKEAGVGLNHRHSEIAFHGIFNFHDMVPEGIEYTREIIDYLKKNL